MSQNKTLSNTAVATTGNSNEEIDENIDLKNKKDVNKGTEEIEEATIKANNNQRSNAEAITNVKHLCKDFHRNCTTLIGEMRECIIQTISEDEQVLNEFKEILKEVTDEEEKMVAMKEKLSQQVLKLVNSKLAFR